MKVFRSNEHVLIVEMAVSPVGHALKDILAQAAQTNAPTLLVAAGLQANKWILKLYGSLDTNTSPDTEAFINELISRGVKKIIADLDKLDYTSSAGLRVMLATTKLIKNRDGDFYICRPNPEVQELFDISGFNMIFSIFPDLEEAMNNF